MNLHRIIVLKIVSHMKYVLLQSWRPDSLQIMDNLSWACEQTFNRERLAYYNDFNWELDVTQSMSLISDIKRIS